jgi:hypothetical protein
LPAAPLSVGVVEFVLERSAGDVSVSAGAVLSLATATAEDDVLAAVQDAYFATTLWVDALHVTSTVLLPDGVDALTCVGAFSVPTDALAVVEPVVVQNATAPVALSTSRTVTRINSWSAHHLVLRAR